MNKKLKNIANAVVRYLLNTNNKNVGDVNELVIEIFNSHVPITNKKTAEQSLAFSKYINEQVKRYGDINA